MQNELVAQYLIEQLKMKPVVVLDSDDFISECRIKEGRPDFPLQIYASMSSKLSLIASDFVIPKTHEKQLARGLIGWARKQSIALIMAMSPLDESFATKQGPEVSAAFSTQSAKERLAQSRTDL